MDTNFRYFKTTPSRRNARDTSRSPRYATNKRSLSREEPPNKRYRRLSESDGHYVGNRRDKYYNSENDWQEGNAASTSDNRYKKNNYASTSDNTRYRRGFPNQRRSNYSYKNRYETRNSSYDFSKDPYTFRKSTYIPGIETNSYTSEVEPNRGQFSFNFSNSTEIESNTRHVFTEHETVSNPEEQLNESQQTESNTEGESNVKNKKISEGESNVRNKKISEGESNVRIKKISENESNVGNSITEATTSETSENQLPSTSASGLEIKREIKQEFVNVVHEALTQPQPLNIRITNVKTLMKEDNNALTNNDESEANGSTLIEQSNQTVNHENNESALLIKQELLNGGAINTNNVESNNLIEQDNVQITQVINKSNEQSSSIQIDNQVLQNVKQERVDEVEIAGINVIEDTMNYDKDEIYVTNLCQTTTTLLLCQLFQKYGHILDIKFLNTPGVKTACIRFQEYQSANKALNENGQLFNGRHMIVKIYGNIRPRYPHRVNVHNLTPDVDREDLWKTFECCGEIITIYISHKSQFGDFVGTIAFKSAKAVHSAMKMKVFLYGRLLAMQKAMHIGRNFDKRKKV